MEHGVQLVFGALLCFGLPVGFFLFCAWVAGRVSPRVQRNQRRRQIETDMHLRELDYHLVDEVAAEWGYDPRDHRDRR
ncbi:hypothetical protein ACE6JH_04910 [Streptomyces nigra]